MLNGPRNDHPADEFSDLDIVMIVDNPDIFLQSNQWLEQIGRFHISFIENTIGGANIECGYSFGPTCYEVQRVDGDWRFKINEFRGGIL